MLVIFLVFELPDDQDESCEVRRPVNDDSETGLLSRVYPGMRSDADPGSAWLRLMAHQLRDDQDPDDNPGYLLEEA